MREEPEETQEPEVREMRKTGFRGRELWKQKPRVSQERVESGDPYLWVLYSRPTLILGDVSRVSTRDAQPGPSALKVSVSPHLRRGEA